MQFSAATKPLQRVEHAQASFVSEQLNRHLNETFLWCRNKPRHTIYLVSDQLVRQLQHTPTDIRSWRGGVMIERIRESVSGPLNQAEVQTRAAQGWKLVAVEWERERADVAAAAQPDAEVPFGLKVSGDCAHLEEDANEREVLVAMMELTIQDGPYSSIADELNRRGFRTRDGVRWTPVSVFQMLPRLIEVGPKIFSSEDWQKRRERMRL